jgi:predicted alpha-1,2-mannosidase
MSFGRFLLCGMLFVGAGGVAAPIAAVAQAADLTRYVDPMIGTGGEGHVFPGATLPFGMVQLSPSSDNPGWNWSSGYNYSGTDIQGFAHTHLSGAGLAAFGDILLMPARKPSTYAGTAAVPGSGYRSRFSHANEVAQPGYYRVHLDDANVDAELTATRRAGFHRYTFDGPAKRYVIIDPTHGIGDHAYRTGVEIVSDREIRGYKRSLSQSTGDRAVYFIAHFSRPFLRASLTDHDKPVGGRDREGSAIKVAIQFPRTGPDSVEVAVAISNTSYAGAEANYQAEATGKTFDQVRETAHKIWLDRLSRIAVDDPSVAHKRIFYTALYHASIAPNLISDVTGDYFVEGKIRHSNIPQFSNFSTWDTYRALHPLLTIVEPRTEGEIVASMVSRHSQAGLTLPIWEAAGHDNRVMIGYPLVAAIGDAVLKGIPGVDPEKAYAAMRASAFDRSKNSNVYDANGMDGYLVYGFVPADVGSSVSKTTEQNYEDWVIGRVAARLGKSADAKLFALRSIGYRQLYDPGSGYLVPRLADGRFVPFDAGRWDHLTQHYVSGNIWAYSAYTPQDMIGAIWLHGGRSAYARWLEGIFTDNRPIAGKQHVDISGFIGRYGHGDEPGHEMPYLFNLAGQPWRTQYYVSRILREMYSDRPDGIVNNDDLGQMSAWYVLSSLGFYPVTPGDLTYQIGTPTFPRAKIALPNGKSFVIEAENVSDSNIYIQSAALNGAPLRRSYLTHQEITAGGVLRLVMGPAPNRNWGSSSEDTSLGNFDDKAPVLIPHLAAWAPYDPQPTSQFATDASVKLVSSEARAIIRYTTDGSEPGTRSTVYSRPILLTGDTLLKAIAFAPGLRPSSMFQKQYRRTATADLPSGYPRIQLEQKDIGYGNPDGSMLIDQVEGTRFYGDGKWTGRQGDITALIDLGQTRQIRSVSVGYLDDPMNGILPPRGIEIWGGDSPNDLKLIGATKVRTAAKITQETDHASIALNRGALRYYRIRVTSGGAMPPRLSAGKTAWLFLDEVLFR